MLFHVTDATGSPGTIPARVLCTTTVFVGFRIWDVAVTVSGILWEAPYRGSAGPA